MKPVRLAVEGMTCAGCARNVERALAAVPGVARVSVDFLGKTARVEPAPTAAAETGALIAAVEAAGYRARVPPSRIADRDAADRRAAYREWAQTGGIGLLLFGGWLLGERTGLPGVISQGCVIVATILAGAPIAWRALRALGQRRLDADVLVTIAVVAAASVHEFFAAGEVAFIMLLGGQLEDYTARRARRSLDGLLALVPARARVRRGDLEQELPAEEVRVGDLVVVRAGERVPVDGVVRKGESAVNQAAITGESIPVDKSVGDEVAVGSLAETGALVIEATRVGEETTLARIARVVEQAQQNTAPIQRTLDRFAGWLVPVMLVLAVGVFLVTREAHRAITVLIVACPCALILATPVAVMAAIARAARAGVLIKGGQHLEAAARLHTIVFDKTGTLTSGEPEVTHVDRFCADHSDAQMVGLAAVAEKLSAHPVARAIRRKADALGLAAVDPTAFAAHHGRGVTAEHQGGRLVVGQQELLAEQAVTMTDELRAHVDEHHEAGHTTVLVAHDGRVCGTICVADTVRTTAAGAVRELRALGIERIVMLTGDHRRVALPIGAALGLDEVVAEVLPEQKAGHIAALKQGGRDGGVAMVGDGINDAPALAVADLGIAMGVSGTDVAHEAADIALMADDLSKIAFAVGLSRRALRVIRQGLWFALVYNVVMVATAASGHLHMIGGAVAHQASSIIVILNAMRLLRYR